MGREKDGLILYRGKIFVSNDGQLRLDIVKAHHDTWSLATLADGR